MYVIREPRLGTHAYTHKTVPNYSIFYAPQQWSHNLKTSKSFIGFLVDVLISYVSGDPKVAQFCVDSTDTADVAPCHTQAAGVCSESSSTDTICHRNHSDVHLKTEFDSQCTKNSEAPLWIADKYCFLMNRYSKNSVLQTSIKKEQQCCISSHKNITHT